MIWPPRARENSIVSALPTHSLRTPEFDRGVHGMMNENPGKPTYEISPKVFKCLKEQ
ncbi:unnamed protein product [Hymenolepis diminuta]|uniref:Uncharacterized protein n=1 Tax=Hymenolepis diminuta TaxID=6216 RepID=A0A564ZB65_HYMDI|nr:unnamed protein product [Hymenolepis diminuta]